MVMEYACERVQFGVEVVRSVVHVFRGDCYFESFEVLVSFIPTSHLDFCFCSCRFCSLCENMTKVSLLEVIVTCVVGMARL